MPIVATTVRLVLRAAGALPLGFARMMGSAVGRITLLLNTRMVMITRQNITHCFPELSAAEQKALVKQSILETARLSMEVPIVWSCSPEWVSRKVVKVHNESLVTAALAEGQGVLVLAPHVGNWEVLGLHLASLAPITNMYQPPKLDSLDPIVRASRQRHGAKLAATDMRGLSKILSALKKGEISGILPDQTPKDPNSGIFAPFFGRSAFTMTLVHKMLQKSGAKPVFAYAKRVPNGFEIFFEQAPEGINSEDQQTSVAALSTGIEQCARAIPAQYQWEYKRFRRRPKGEPDPYRD